jgi:hypothetical protein
MLLDSEGPTVGGGMIYLYIQARADSTNLYMDVLNPSATGQVGFGNPWVFKYYILQETAS